MSTGGDALAPPPPHWARQEFCLLAAQFRETVSFRIYLTLPNFGETFAKFALISLRKKGRGVSEGPRREEIQKNLRILPILDIMDIGTIIFVIGLVGMLKIL